MNKLKIKGGFSIDGVPSPIMATIPEIFKLVNPLEIYRCEQGCCITNPHNALCFEEIPQICCFFDFFQTWDLGPTFFPEKKRVPTVDGSEIPFPTTVWMVLKPVVNDGDKLPFPQLVITRFLKPSTVPRKKAGWRRHLCNLAIFFIATWKVWVKTSLLDEAFNLNSLRTSKSTHLHHVKNRF